MQKAWYEQAIVKINALSNEVYARTNIGRANVILANPIDASIFEAFLGYGYVVNNTGGDVTTGLTVATLANQYKVVTSPNVPKGKMILCLKPEEERYACYLYSPYVPVTIYPYPLGSQPTLTFKTRYAKKVIRKDGFAILNIV